MKSGAIVRDSVLVKGPTTDITLDRFLGECWIKPLIEMRFKIPGKFSVSEQWSNIS